MTRKYAVNATTPVSTSQEEIQKIIIKKLGGTQLNFGYDLEHKRELISFKVQGMPALITISLSDDERERKRLWRCLLLYIKNLWVSVDAGIVSIEQVILPYFLLPNNKTLGEILPAKIRTAIDTGKIPALLPGFTEDE